MNIELKDILVLLSIVAILAGFFWWIMGRVLTDKKDKMLLAFRIEKIEEHIHDLRADVDKLEVIEQELNIVKEQIKHL